MDLPKSFITSTTTYYLRFVLIMPSIIARTGGDPLPEGLSADWSNESLRYGCRDFQREPIEREDHFGSRATRM